MAGYPKPPNSGEGDRSQSEQIRRIRTRRPPVTSEGETYWEQEINNPHADLVLGADWGFTFCRIRRKLQVVDSEGGSISKGIIILTMAVQKSGSGTSEVLTLDSKWWPDRNLEYLVGYGQAASLAPAGLRLFTIDQTSGIVSCKDIDEADLPEFSHAQINVAYAPKNIDPDDPNLV